ncbi:MAG: hypothetical protein OEW67_15395 [Cyclobacteriaceae bacterium]|nr:hypothetical protein [Cyclobacteriaceae bacterium]
MKKTTYFSLFILLFSAFGVHAQNGMKNLILNKDLKIEKLVIKNEDLSYSLGSVNIREDVWLEYDRDGKEIGKANILEFTEDRIRIKWIFTENGADVGDITIYNYEMSDNKMVFNILFDNKEQGFFEAML